MAYGRGVNLYTLVLRGVKGACPERGAYLLLVRDGRRAGLCEAESYAHVKVSLDVCRLLRLWALYTSSALCNNFNTGLARLTDYHVNGPLDLLRALCYGPLKYARRASGRIHGGDEIRFRRIRFRRKRFDLATAHPPWCEPTNSPV